MNRSEEFMRQKEREESRETRLEDGDGEDYKEEITMRELVRCLNAAKNTSPGRDEIAYKIIRHTDESFKKLLLKLYNRVYAEHNIPSKCLSSIVIPLHKIGKGPRKPKSYRPISLSRSIPILLLFVSLTH